MTMRARMSIRFNEHVVTDMWTGKEYMLPAEVAWDFLKMLNKEQAA